jgi:glycosyltransferase involved in cell wall biosynthesis
MNKTLKVLILCYDFPPLTSAGSIRPYSWYLHASKYGYEPIVVTRRWLPGMFSISDKSKGEKKSKLEKEKDERGTIYYATHQMTYKDRLILKVGLNNKNFRRRIISMYERVFRWFLPMADDMYYIYSTAEKVVKDSHPDVIIATGEPFILFKYAYKLHKKYNIPWVADYRDGWYTNHTLNSRGMIDKLIRKFELFFERKYLKSTLFFCIVSQPLAETIQKVVYPQKAFILSNGAELDFFKNAIPLVEKGYFILMYTGIVHDFICVDYFVEGLDMFVKEFKPPDFQVHFYGIKFIMHKGVQKILNYAKFYPQWIKIKERLPRQEIIKYQLGATVQLSFLSHSQEEGIMASKTYEYIATRRPVLAVQSTPGKTTTLFPNRGVQYFANNAEEVYDLLKWFYERFKRGENMTTDITEEEKFSISREYGTKILFEEIDKYLVKR